MYPQESPLELLAPLLWWKVCWWMKSLIFQNRRQRSSEVCWSSCAGLLASKSSPWRWVLGSQAERRRGDQIFSKCLGTIHEGGLWVTEKHSSPSRLKRPSVLPPSFSSCPWFSASESETCQRSQIWVPSEFRGEPEAQSSLQRREGSVCCLFCQSPGISAL